MTANILGMKGHAYIITPHMPEVIFRKTSILTLQMYQHGYLG
jgi:hypothetical protein